MAPRSSTTGPRASQQSSARRDPRIGVDAAGESGAALLGITGRACARCASPDDGANLHLLGYDLRIGPRSSLTGKHTVVLLDVAAPRRCRSPCDTYPCGRDNHDFDLELADGPDAPLLRRQAHRAAARPSGTPRRWTSPTRRLACCSTLAALRATSRCRPPAIVTTSSGRDRAVRPPSLLAWLLGHPPGSPTSSHAPAVVHKPPA